MPKKVMDYSNTHFYKIVCTDLNITDCYVGHAVNFTKRKCTHENNSLNPLNKKTITSMYINLFVKMAGLIILIWY